VKLTRRKLLLLTGTTAIGACVGVRGCAFYDDAAFGGLAHLSARQGLILAAAIDALLPPAAARDAATLLGHVRAIDRYLGGLPDADRGQLGQGLYALEHGTLPWGGHVRRFSSLDRDDRTDSLASWQTSSIAMCRLLYRSLKALTFLAYYRDAVAFATVGYPGPILPGGLPEARARYAALAAPAGRRPR
jgi:hypothetical protein